MLAPARHHAAAGVIDDPLPGAVGLLDSVRNRTAPKRSKMRGEITVTRRRRHPVFENVVARALQRPHERALAALQDLEEPCTQCGRPGLQESSLRCPPGSRRPANSPVDRTRRSSRCGRARCRARPSPRPPDLTSATSHFGAVANSPDHVDVLLLLNQRLAHPGVYPHPRSPCSTLCAAVTKR